MINKHTETYAAPDPTCNFGGNGGYPMTSGNAHYRSWANFDGSIGYAIHPMSVICRRDNFTKTIIYV